MSTTQFCGFDSDVITLKVGPTEQILRVHREAIMNVPFFEAALKEIGGVPQFQEGKNKCIAMPEDDPQLVARLLRYLYRSANEHSNDADEQEQLLPDVTELRDTVKVYILAHKLGAENAENAALDAVAAWFRRRQMADVMSIVMLRTAGLDRTLLYQLVLEEFAVRIKSLIMGNYKGRPLKKSSENFKDGVKSLTGEDSLRIMEVQFGMFEEPDYKAQFPSDGHLDNPCAWHTHEHTKLCPPKEKPCNKRIDDLTGWGQFNIASD